ncbi:hypothetical protein GCM10018772_66960 [Streptomyces fumanus]|uniref:Uncharacterized protein n=1 Tax=Streptomyces fumanus TaxID=67302 RepID=A0A919EB15_9ACTN|nr:hypothetical protein GCM10018772_66960 [Streptomyces fumanus]
MGPAGSAFPPESQALRPHTARAVSEAATSDARDAGRKSTTTSCGRGSGRHLVSAMTVLARFRAALIKKLHYSSVAPCWYEHGEDDTAEVRAPFPREREPGRKQ